MIVSASAEVITHAASILKSGGLVAFPTETVYGLGANALDATAVKKIFDAKERPATHPLIVHVDALDTLSQLTPAFSIPEYREKIIKVADFWPGPLSLVLPKSDAVPEEVTGGKDSVAVRIPAHPIALELLQAAQIPIAAPSANRYTYVSPTTAAHVEQGLGNAVDMIIDGGMCDIGIESTVLSLVHESPTILRHGAVTKEQLTQALGEQVFELTEAPTPDEILSPGSNPVHYSPSTAVILRSDFNPEKTSGRVGLISFRAYEDDLQFDFAAVTCLSDTGDLNEIAKRLFLSLREMDSLDLNLIVIDSCEERGLGRAIMDRVTRATKRNRVQ